jgi:hypothetical protein
MVEGTTPTPRGFGLMAISYRDPSAMAKFHGLINYPKISVA